LVARRISAIKKTAFFTPQRYTVIAITDGIGEGIRPGIIRIGGIGNIGASGRYTAIRALGNGGNG